ncbi:MAG: DUF4402 domain-containing protein [Micavibrio aeruginosavorus]|uniref:DUF4402 domain-containing protein n=1 Tax=Micavibrio aeruginosavorus TaxID=349221 RepID=A0A7T5R3P4_9BACT|nr:MAG: DUF4402 domain-containing protein [Micavibrio aeruginosavorus]
MRFSGLQKTSALTKTAGMAAVAVSLSVFMYPETAAAVTAIGNAEGTIVNMAVPTLNDIQELNFGAIISGGAGTVDVSTGGVGTPTGVNLVPSSGLQQGIMRIVGNAAALVDISMTAPSYAVSNGTATMNVNAFDIGNGPGNAHTVTIGGTNVVDVNVGATLNVGAAQSTGTYTGTYTMNAAYQ